MENKETFQIFDKRLDVPREVFGDLLRLQEEVGADEVKDSLERVWAKVHELHAELRQMERKVIEKDKAIEYYRSDSDKWYRLYLNK